MLPHITDLDRILLAYKQLQTMQFRPNLAIVSLVTMLNTAVDKDCVETAVSKKLNILHSYLPSCGEMT